MNDPWPYTLDELCLEVERCLEHYGFRERVIDHRISAAPDARTVRYYTSLGLVDRPRIVSRHARYGPRNLVQLLAVKALQVQDLALADIQQRLFGRSEAELLAIVEAAAAALQPAAPAFHAVVWREITIEPGLKLLVEESWRPTQEPSRLEARIIAALAALHSPPPNPKKSS